MARILGSLTTSHVPAIGGAIAKGLQTDPYWKPFFDGFGPVHRWLQDARPDVVVVFYNDHGLNFFLDRMPTFAVGAAASYGSADEGWGIPTVPAFTGHAPLSWHVVEHLVGRDFDLTTCQEMLVDHAVTVPMTLLWPGRDWQDRGIQLLPIHVNTVQFPLASAARCYALGRAVGEALASWPGDERVLVMGTGGLSHQLDGPRAGFINKDFDLQFLESLVHEPRWATRYSIHELVEKTGTQGVELVMWLAARGALEGAGVAKVRRTHQNYHIPISNTASGLLLLEPA
ncbi:MAG: protocatechuate 3,4-dioxygenase [Rubrivivax sp.]|nr:protocatechuate 3,4-dioxygenase [Rubrivivax sp.]